MFHINPKTGEVGRCRAEKSCPFGGEDIHFSTKEDASKAAELVNKAVAGGLSFRPVTKKSKESSVRHTPEGKLLLGRDKNGIISTDARKLKGLSAEDKKLALKHIANYNDTVQSGPHWTMEQNPVYMEQVARIHSSRNRKMTNAKNKLQDLGIEID